MATENEPAYFIPTFPDIFAYAEKQAQSREVLQRTVNWIGQLSSASKSLTYVDWRSNALYRSRSASTDVQKTFQIYLKQLDSYFTDNGDVISLSTAATTVERLISNANILINVSEGVLPMNHKLLTFGPGQLLGLQIDPKFDPESPNLKFFAEETLWHIHILTRMHTDMTPDYRAMPGQIGYVLRELKYEYLPPLPITASPEGYTFQ